MFPPSLQKDKDIIERIQQWANKSIQELKLKSYEALLQPLNLYPLKNRHLRGDLMSYSILNTSKHCLWHPLRLSPNTNPRVSVQILKIRHSRTDCRSSFRVVKFWNSLTDELVKATKESISSWYTNTFLSYR